MTVWQWSLVAVGLLAVAIAVGIALRLRAIPQTKAVSPEPFVHSETELPMSLEENEFGEAFADTQGRALALYFILREVVVALAQQSNDPQKHISDMYERVCSYSDQMAAPGEKAASVYTRELIDRFFSQAHRRL